MKKYGFLWTKRFFLVVLFPSFYLFSLLQRFIYQGNPMTISIHPHLLSVVDEFNDISRSS